MSNELLDLARLGVEAQAFKRSELYKFLFLQSSREEEDLLGQLREADPEDPAGIRDLQNKLTVIDMFRTYLDEIENSGRLAEENLREIDSFED